MSVQKTNSLRAKSNAKTLRKSQTPAEKLLWSALRNRKINDLKFRRQHPIDMFVADFYCHEKKLVVELDGDSHEDKQDYDRERDDWLRSRGFFVVRIGNNDVMNDVDAVVKYLATVCDER